VDFSDFLYQLVVQQVAAQQIEVVEFGLHTDGSDYSGGEEDTAVLVPVC